MTGLPSVGCGLKGFVVKTPGNVEICSGFYFTIEHDVLIQTIIMILTLSTEKFWEVQYRPSLEELSDRDMRDKSLAVLFQLLLCRCMWSVQTPALRRWLWRRKRSVASSCFSLSVRQDAFYNCEKFRVLERLERGWKPWVTSYRGRNTPPPSFSFLFLQNKFVNPVRSGNFTQNELNWELGQFEIFFFSS